MLLQTLIMFMTLTWSCSFVDISKLIQENGGRVVGLTEPKLTHVVIDKRDDSRRIELIKRTSKYVTVLGCGFRFWLMAMNRQTQASAPGYLRVYSSLFG